LKTNSFEELHFNSEEAMHYSQLQNRFDGRE
jgi:hypothetical protein